MVYWNALVSNVKSIVVAIFLCNMATRTDWARYIRIYIRPDT